jgi:hypothetical protein
MKLIDRAYYEDYGHEWYFQLIQCYSNFALLDVSIQWDDFPATELFPMLLISFGSRSLTGFTFRWKWFEIRVDLFTTAPRNLEYYRRDYD